MDRVRVAVHCIYKLHFYCMDNFTEKKNVFFSETGWVWGTKLCRHVHDTFLVYTFP